MNVAMNVEWVGNDPKLSEKFHACWTRFDELARVEMRVPWADQIKGAACTYFAVPPEAFGTTSSLSGFGPLVSEDDGAMFYFLRTATLHGPYQWVRAQPLVRRREDLPELIGIPDTIVRELGVGGVRVDAIDTATVQMVAVNRLSFDPLAAQPAARESRIRAVLAALIADQGVVERLVFPPKVDDGVTFCDDPELRFAWSPVGMAGNPATIHVGVFAGQLYFLRLKQPQGWIRRPRFFRELDLDKYFEAGPSAAL